MQTVRYRGRSDVRIITAATFTAAGLSSPTVTWQKSNGYEVVLDDPVAAYVLSQGDFELGDPNTKFGDLFDVPVRTEWQRDTLSSPVTWQSQVFTVDGAQAFAWTVANRRLRFTGPVASLGNHRSVLLHPNTNYTSCSVKSLWWGPSEFNVNPTRRPQLGHVHRYQDAGARKRFISVWSNIFGGPNPEALQVAIWETDGTTLFLGDILTVGGLSSTSRNGLIQYTKRFTFGVTLQQMNAIPPHAGYEMPHNGIAGLLTGMTQAGLNSPATQAFTAAVRTAGVTTLTYGAAHGRSVGDVLDVVGVNTTYSGLHTVTATPLTTTLQYAQTGVADAGTTTGTTQLTMVTNGGDAASGMIQVAVPTAADLEDKVGGGLWTPYYPWRVFPYWVKSWVLDLAGVPNVFVKQWPYGLPEPDDSGPFTYGPTPITLGTATAIPTGPGLHGVIAAHAHSGAFGEYGNLEFRRLRAA